MNYIERVRSSLKNGCDVRLGQRTLICGPNGSGKSTIVQSIELATTGCVSDMEGRERVKLSGALARLFPLNGPLRVECTTSDGQTFSWEMDRKNTNTKAPVVSVPTTIRFPVQEMKELLASDGNAIASWLEAQVVGASGKEELLRKMPPDLRDDVEKFIRRGGKSDLLALAQQAKTDAKTLRANATRAEKTISQLVEGVPMPMLESDKQRMQARINELDASPRGMSAVELDKVKAELSRLVAAFVQNQTDLSKLTVDPKTLTAVQKLVKAKQFAEAHTEVFGTDDCWVCGTGTAHQREQHQQNLDIALSRMKPQVDAIQHLGTLEAEAQTLQAKMEKLADVIKTVPVSSASEERDELIRLLAADHVSAQTWANAHAQRAEVEHNRKKADLLTRIGDELAKNGKDILRQRKLEFEERVSAYLPEGEVFGVDLDTARVGLLRNGELHSALSGAEWSRVLLALTSAQASSSTPCILIPDDRAWDRDTLQRVMKSLSKSPFQIILMATVNPGPVEGWTLVETV